MLNLLILRAINYNYIMEKIIIGVISDTHKKTKLQAEAIDVLKSKGAQYLLHLGDLELEENLKALKESNLPYAAVFGNNDIALRGLEGRYKICKEPYYLKIKNLTIKMMHLPYYLSADSDIVLYGHTHKFSVEFKNSTLFLNPGEVCARDKNLSECAILEAQNDKFIVKYLYKEPKANSWEEKIFEFERAKK